MNWPPIDSPDSCIDQPATAKAFRKSPLTRRRLKAKENKLKTVKQITSKAHCEKTLRGRILALA